MGPQDDVVYEFGPFQLDVEDKLLRREGTIVPLEPNQFQVLTALVGVAGRLVTRDDLIRTVWKGTHVDEGSLTVTISTLRRKLGDSPSQHKYIETVPKSGYRFVAAVTRLTPPAAVPGTESPGPVQSLPAAGVLRRNLTPRVVGVASVMALGALLAGWYSSRSGFRDPAPAAALLYPFGGIQNDPSFSPEGDQIVFAWRPPRSDNSDIYVLRIGDLEATRLTTHPAIDEAPAWSPDGRRIAFIRRGGPRGEIVLISPVGGPEQKVGETAGSSLSWSADSTSFAIADRLDGQDGYSIFMMAASGGPKRQMTFPIGEKTYGDSSPVISPDGRTLAFVRHSTYDVADLFVQPLSGAPARQVTFDKRQIRGVAWSPDGQELVFSSNRSGRHQIWRVLVNGNHRQPLPVPGTSDGRSPTVSGDRRGQGARLVYQAFAEDFNVRVLARGADHASSGSTSTVFAASLRDEQSPRLSPDGGRLAFVSDRSGWFEVWVCAFPDASACRQLTAFRQGYVGSPSWSPDSERIAFDARVDGNADLYVVRADGGQPVRLTQEPSVESRTSWSADGRSIYFRSDRTGTHQIWKMPAAGGPAMQVTKNGGFDALESPDGRSLYYVQGRHTWGLWRVPVTGGDEARVPRLGSVTASSWTVVDTGILWIDLRVANPPAAIRAYTFATSEVSNVAELNTYVLPSSIGLSAAADGKAIVWSQMDRSAHGPLKGLDFPRHPPPFAPRQLSLLESSELEHSAGMLVSGERPQARTEPDKSLERTIRWCQHRGAAHFLHRTKSLHPPPPRHSLPSVSLR
jgi:Tol biopolymer transport system component/DNA-binding winged helix-turn-helix (wHTH) protein